MKEFMMIFRHTPDYAHQPTHDDIQSSIRSWQDWIGGIAAQGKFQSTNQLDFAGKVVKPNDVLTDGPYAEVKEIVGGYLIVKCDNLDEAVEMAKSCPVLAIGGHVEVRSFMKIDI